jgi:putative ABC transport system permease protein
MIQNFLKIAFRDLLKQKGLTLINILSLSLGLAAFSLFLLYAVNEFNYDRFHADNDRLFRVYRWTELMQGGETEGDPYLPIPLGPALQADFPDVENFTRMRDAWGESFVRANGTVSRMGITHADPQFFDVLTFPLKYGNPATALKELNSIVLTEKTALKLFGESNPIGRTLEIKIDDHFEPFTVSAVAENMSSNTSVVFEALCNFEKLLTLPSMARRKTSWNHSAYFTFVKLRPGSGLSSDAARLRQFRQKYYPNEEQELRKEGVWHGENPPVSYRMQPLQAIHTQTMVAGGQVAPIDTKSVWILLGIAAGILAIAGINFTTLAIGRSAGRAREVGVRKVMGSDRKMLIGQFLTESMLLAGISALFGLVLAHLMLPNFNRLADRALVFSFEQFPEMTWMLGGLVLLTGLLAGCYPALVLSGFRPVEILKSKVRLGGSNFFTKSLVTGQFVLSIGLIVSTLIILQQIKFMRSKNPGFDRENVVVVDASDTNTKRVFPLFKQAALAHPEVMGVAGSELGIGAGEGWSRSGWEDNGTHREVYEYFVDSEFLGVMKMQLLAGRNFEPGNSLDTVSSVVINERMMRDFGWTLENAVGQQLLGYYDAPQKPLPTVIGVVKNFHFRPMKEEVGPQMFHQFADYAPYKYFVRLQPGDPGTALAALKLDWEKVESELPFKYSFLDDNLNRFYKSEARLGKIVLWAGGISIFLACLGLLGLAALAVVNRMKEIGIRKVLGASVAGITGLLAKDFLKLVFIAILIASPIAYHFMNKWLADFAYRIDIQWWMFAGAGAAALGVAFLTVSFQSVKAALANPVKSLRSE